MNAPRRGRPPKGAAQQTHEHAAAARSAVVRVRVLFNGRYGVANSIAEIQPDGLAEAIASGEIDAHPDAVAAVEAQPR